METDTERARRRFNRVKRETLRRGKRIASRGKRGFFSILFSRSGLIGVMLLAQLILFVALSLWIQALRLEILHDFRDDRRARGALHHQ